jgi:hypothetical protein
MCKTCYYCGKPATSTEHVPPKALFPEQKDSPEGVDYRKNLFTVPSCDEHNSVKSHDDEYIMYILAMSLPSNAIGRLLYKTKVTRAIKRNSAIIRMLLKDKRPVILRDTQTNTWLESIALKVDYNRLKNAFAHIAKAIYYMELNRIHIGDIKVHSEFLLSLENVEANKIQSQLSASLDVILAQHLKHGDNPDVFFYQVAQAGTDYVVRMTFFGDTKVYAIMPHHTLTEVA